ncbi:MAG TPA: nicotinamidase [Candidatus Dormibacteraeota bacterium]|nr:nicotinamidase [Candidatus Dormibacteraeota bacterium]
MPPSRDIHEALLIVDPQVDFCPGGALPAPAGDTIFPAVNRASQRLPLVVASRDWHPPDHCSFRERGGPWPPHCVAGTPGAEFHPELDRSRVHEVFSKATEADQEAYSAFQGTASDGTDLGRWLRERGVRRLYVAGLATDYCVRASVLDALKAGFEVVVLTDAIRAVDAQPGDGDRALAEMRAAGAATATSEEIA